MSVTIPDRADTTGQVLAPARAYARLMALATLLDPDRARRVREAAVVLLDACEAESEAA